MDPLWLSHLADWLGGLLAQGQQGLNHLEAFLGTAAPHPHAGRALLLPAPVHGQRVQSSRGEGAVPAWPRQSWENLEVCKNQGPRDVASLRRGPAFKLCWRSALSPGKVTAAAAQTRAGLRSARGSAPFSDFRLACWQGLENCTGVGNGVCPPLFRFFSCLSRCFCFPISGPERSS